MLNRSIIALLFVMLTGGLAIFFWKEQLEGYSFSLESERQILRGAIKEAEKFEEEIEFPEIPEEFTQALETYQQMQQSTSSVEFTTTTSSEEEWIKIFEELDKLENSTSTEL